MHAAEVSSDAANIGVATGAVFLQQSKLRPRRKHFVHAVDVLHFLGVRRGRMLLDRNIDCLAVAGTELHGRFWRVVVRLVDHHFVFSGQGLRDGVLALYGEHRVPELII